MAPCLPVLRASQAEKDRGSCAELERSPNGAVAWVVWPWRVSGCRGTQGCTGLECGSLSLQLPYSCQLCASKTRYCPQSRSLCLCPHFSHCPKTAEAFIAVQHFSPSVGSGQDLQDCQHYLSGDNPPRGRLGLLNHPCLDAAPFWGTGDQQNPPAIWQQPFCTKSFRIPLCTRDTERGTGCYCRLRTNWWSLDLTVHLTSEPELPLLGKSAVVAMFIWKEPGV